MLKALRKLLDLELDTRYLVTPISAEGCRRRLSERTGERWRAGWPGSEAFEGLVDRDGFQVTPALSQAWGRGPWLSNTVPRGIEAVGRFRQGRDGTVVATRLLLEPKVGFLTGVASGVGFALFILGLANLVIGKPQNLVLCVIGLALLSMRPLVVRNVRQSNAADVIMVHLAAILSAHELSEASIDRYWEFQASTDMLVESLEACEGLA